MTTSTGIHPLSPGAEIKLYFRLDEVDLRCGKDGEFQVIAQTGPVGLNLDGDDIVISTDGNTTYSGDDSKRGEADKESPFQYKLTAPKGTLIYYMKKRRVLSDTLVATRVIPST